ncbi:MAG TPA: hypothetical protein EYP56_16785 [Planctomycetaceae bacterium]|nr:hypothetical protein [Planctomycetaceae bacterium]HIQ22655.1 hypothetical protein [Planctomycetota bacterium]
MSQKKYLLGGWIPPLFRWNDPDYCEHGCPVCRRARRGNRVAKVLQAVELVATFGGCPWGRARRRKYGVGPDEPLPPEAGQDAPQRTIQTGE